MKQNKERTSFKKSNRNTFLNRFKTQVKDSNSIENLRISKINESNYKIYQTVNKNGKDNQILPTKMPLKISLQKIKGNEKINLIRNHILTNQNIYQRGKTVLQHRSYLQNIKAYNQEFFRICFQNLDSTIVEYKQIKSQQRKIKLQQTLGIKEIIQILVQNTHKLRNYKYQAETNGILLLLAEILKDIIPSLKRQIQNCKNHLIKTAENCQYSQINELSSGKDYFATKNRQQRCPLQDHKNEYTQFLSMSSFKIQNQLAHHHQYLTIYSPNKKPTELQSKKQQHSFTRTKTAFENSVYLQNYLQTEKKKCNRREGLKHVFSKKQIISELQVQNSRTMPFDEQSNYKLIESNDKEKKPKSQTIFFENCRGLCQFIKCLQNEKVGEGEGSRSETKRQVLNSIIAVLNNKYSRNIQCSRE